MFELFRKNPSARMAFCRGATLEDALRWRRVDERPTVEHARVWGPVLADAAAAVGCVRAAAMNYVCTLVWRNKQLKLMLDERAARLHVAHVSHDETTLLLAIRL